jgi:hypothetical protein
MRSFAVIFLLERDICRTQLNPFKSNRKPKMISIGAADVEECIETSFRCQNSDVSDLYSLGSGFEGKIVGGLRIEQRISATFREKQAAIKITVWV